jgi:hypothetical protein
MEPAYGRCTFPPDDQSMMTPSTSNVFLQQEQCLQNVHELFETSRWNDEESLSCASLCGAHDKLLEVLQLGDEITTLVDGEIVRSRVLLKEGSMDTGIEQVRRRILLQADLLRAVMLVSHKLLSKVDALPVTSSKGDESTDDQLKVIIRQVKVLLQVLSNKYSENLSSNVADQENLPSNLPSNFPLFEELLQQQGQTFNDVDDSISFDKDQLEKEEDELLQMAHTPTPQERQGANGTALMDVENAVPSTTTLLHAPMVSEDRNLTTVPVELDGRGFLRIRKPLNSTIDAPSSGDSIWLLTAETTIFYNTPMLRLSNVVTYCKSSFTASMISLNVGSQGRVWWERISAIVQRLKVASELQEQLQSAWTTEVFQKQRSVSKGLVACPSTLLN